MIAHSSEIRQKTLELLQAHRSYKEIAQRTGIPAGTIEDWATSWRKDGLLSGYVKPGMEFVQKAKIMSNGYYPSLRKRYASMKWTDKKEHRTFGFTNIIAAVHYYLDDGGKPRPCAYCGAFPPQGSVWGLDRLDSNIGHVPGNLVPCCTSATDSPYLSCQTSKSKFSLESWMTANMARSYGRHVSGKELNVRLEGIKILANTLANK